MVVSSVPHDGVTIRNSENGKLSPPLSPVRNVRKDFDGDLDFEPLLTSRYPMGDHEGNPLHENVVCFCLPWGIQLRKDPCMPKVRVLEKGLNFFFIIHCDASHIEMQCLSRL